MHRRAAVVAFCLSLSPSVARALDKQGSAHGGSIAGEDSGVALDGALSLGVSLYNPSFAARPDNTGLALFRYALHADLDLIGRRLSIPLDINLVTDRLKSGAGKLAPSELDIISGLTSTWRLGPTAIELGSRFQHERPVDKGNFTQTFVDTRARLLYSVRELAPALEDKLGGGDLSGWLTLGWFTINPGTYSARPDLTGVAFLRYAANVRLSFWKERLAIGVDASMFTDKETHKLRPSELDLTPEIIARASPLELHLAYERDMPLDRGGLVQQFVYLLAVWEFSVLGGPTEALENRTNVVSP